MKTVFRGPLRSAVVALFVVGLLLVMVNPPSMSGAEELLRWVSGALALAILTAWATVALAGRRELSEAEFEQVVRRTEDLGRRPEALRRPTAFDLLVADAIDRLPANFRELLETTPVVVSHRGAEHHAYGRYYGDGVARDDFPDRIVIYQDTLERDFGHDPELLAAQVEQTLRHELAHHLGWRERGVRELGL